MTDCDSGAVFGFILPSSSWTAQFRSAHTAAGNRDILPVQDCTTGTLLECGGSCCQLQAGLLLLRIWWQAVICSITLHDVISYVIASVCRFWASCPFRLRLLYKTSIRHDCREYIYIYTNNKSNNKKNETLCYIIFVKWYYILHGVLVYSPCCFSMCMAAQDKQEKQYVKARIITWCFARHFFPQMAGHHNKYCTTTCVSPIFTSILFGVFAGTNYFENKIDKYSGKGISIYRTMWDFESIKSEFSLEREIIIEIIGLVNKEFWLYNLEI